MSKRTPLGMWAEARRADREQEKVGIPKLRVPLCTAPFLGLFGSGSEKRVRPRSTSGWLTYLDTYLSQLLLLAMSLARSFKMKSVFRRLPEKTERRRPSTMQCNQSKFKTVLKKSDYRFDCLPLSGRGDL